METAYAIYPADPGAHLFQVTVSVTEPDPQGQLLRLPAWIPGSYLVRDFARHIVRLRALDGSGRKVRVDKLDKHTWRCAPVRAGQALTVAYEVYANDLSVRGAHLDTERGFFNGTSVFLAVAGQEDRPCAVTLFPPPGEAGQRWRVATGLTRARGTRAEAFGLYRALNYDELIDCPVEMGTHIEAAFVAGGVRHRIALAGGVSHLDRARLCNDLARICETQIRLFEPRRRTPPFPEYHFLTLAVDEGYGGLEHRNSTALICRRDDLPATGMGVANAAYRRFLGLASHEYFHAWNVKRIRPARFIPYDLTRENPTALLWLFEGFTAYYDDLMVCRAGLITPAQYLEELAGTLSTVTQQSGRLKQSLAESSFDAWIKYYRPDENSPNSTVSYYQKGSLVAAALDLTLRQRSGGRRSLDDVMRALWRAARDGGERYAGLAEDGLPEVVQAATGIDLSREIHAWTQTTEDPPLPSLLAAAGVLAHASPVVDAPARALLGCRVGADGRIGQVFDGGPAQAAGLSAGDQIVALDGLRAQGPRLDALLARCPLGARVEVHAFRRDALRSFAVTLERHPPKRWSLGLKDGASPEARRLRRAWIGG
jgi:predicted metalloprotease with PDZ domain